MKDNVVKNISDSFRINSVEAIAEAFAGELERALHNRPSSLKILPSYLSSPTGQERGEYIAVDLGGTNVRVMAVSLLGQGRSIITKQISRPLADAGQGYDLTAAASTGRDMFAFIAGLVEEVRLEGQSYKLGLTFSYPMQQDAVDKARLLEWTKEIKTSATVGRDIKLMLTEALEGRGLYPIMPTAIINDTVAAFMAGAYSEPAVCAGSICGTGHNTCYCEPSLYTPSGLPMIVNIEAGNFAAVPENFYDQRLDSQSLDPGKQRLEKMVSGKYMGELFRLVFLDLLDQQILPSPYGGQNCINQPFMLGAEVLSWLRADAPLARKQLDDWLCQQGFPHYRDQDIAMLKAAGHAIIDRAVQLIAASYLAVTERSRQLKQGQAVAVDGSVFLKLPGFAAAVEKLINQHREGYPAVALIPVANGSSLGAAVAAAQEGRSM